MELTEKEKEAREAIIKVLEDCLKSLETHFESIGGVSQNIPVSMIKASHKVFLDSFKKASEETVTAES